jgi:hypothetical protein
LPPRSSVSAKLSCERLEEREVPALYAVGLLSPSGGDVGQSSATFAGGIALNNSLPTQNGKALVDAATPTAAIQAAFVNTITATVGTQSANYSAGVGTIGTTPAAQTPFVVTPTATAGQFTLRLEDLAAMPGMASDWDYDDRSWLISVIEPAPASVVTVSVASASTPTQPDGPVTLTATVTSAYPVGNPTTPTGTVTFTTVVNGSPLTLGTATLVGTETPGTATATLTPIAGSLPPNTYPVKVIYNGSIGGAILPVISPPTTMVINTVVGRPDYYIVPASGTLTVSLADGVLANDFAASGVTPTAVLNSGLASNVGNLTLNSNGTLTFVAGANFVDTAEFTYIPTVAGAVQQAQAVTVRLMKAVGPFINQAMKASVSLQQVTFATKHDAITKDGGGKYTGPNWLDQNTDGVPLDEGDQRTPVSYTRGKKMEVQNVKFLVGLQDAAIFYNAGKDKLRVRAKEPGPDGVKFGYTGQGVGFAAKYSETQLPIFGVQRVLTLPVAESDEALADKIRYDENFQLNWEISFDGGKNWISPNVGTSKTTLYVTHGDPKIAPLVEALLYISTKDVTHQNAQAAFVTEVFKKFQSTTNDPPKVYRTGGGEANLLKYYGEWSTTNGEWIALIKNKDGTCEAWAKLLMAALEAHGITAEMRVPTTNNALGTSGGKENLLVKGWNFAAMGNLPAGTKVNLYELLRYANPPVQGQPGAEAFVYKDIGDLNGLPNVKLKLQPGLPYDDRRDVTYTHFNVPVDGDTLYPALGTTAGHLSESRLGNEYKWKATPAPVPGVTDDTTGIPGQGRVNPASIFKDHVLVKYDDNIYDPSYGKVYTSMKNFEDTAVVGFVLETELNEMTVDKDLDGVNGVENKKVRVFVFRKNENTVQDLI